MINRNQFVGMLAGSLLCSLVAAQTLQIVKPESVGLAGLQLQKIGDVIQKHIDAGEVPGAIALVVRNGGIAYLDARGKLNATEPLRTDTVFWVASMTKPIVASAVMTMVEAGKVSLDDPVSKFIPEFAAPARVRVLRPGSLAEKPQYDLVPAQRALTVHDLITHTAGLQSIGVPNDTVPTILPGETLASHIPRLASATLEFQPGSMWAYSNATGFDVLARIVEVASGQTFYDFVQQRILNPLGMKSSSFGPRADLAKRTMNIAPALAANACVNGKTYACGSAGMWISAADYAHFAQMLLNGGEFNGKRLLKASSVAAMSSNQSGNLFTGASGIPGADKGVGFGFSMLTVFNSAAAGLAVPDGSFGWDGVGTRRFWVIPRYRMVIVMLVPSGNAVSLHRDIERAAIAALSSQPYVNQPGGR
jgi:CubicO group peptidase (beta-lactamase class C family)